MSAPDEQPPSVGATDPDAWSVAAIPASPEPRGPARVWVHVVGALLLSPGALVFVAGLFAGTRSMDLPWGDGVRYGLLGNGWLTVWRCSEGHRHVSAPFWLASLLLCLAALVIWRLLARRFTKPPPK